MAKASAPVHLCLSWDDPNTGQHYERVNPLPITIGRAASLNTIVLNNKQVSRQHVWLGPDNDKILITDQGSTNGTLVGGRAIKQATLKVGDSFRVGPFTISTTLPFHPDENK